MHHVRVRLKNRIDEIDRAIRTFLDMARREKIRTETASQIALVVDEILNNIVSYAYPHGGEHHIDLSFEIRAAELIVVISDQGIPFNPFTKDPPNTKLPLEERKIGGLGIHLVRNLMDNVSYERKRKRNVVTLEKKL